MSFQWSPNSIVISSVTLYESNMTLNKSASKYFESARFVLIGLDDKEMRIGIKPVTDADLDNNTYPSSNLHRISIGKSYARISDKPFMHRIKELFNIEFSESKGAKFESYFDNDGMVLCVDLSRMLSADQSHD